MCAHIYTWSAMEVEAGITSDRGEDISKLHFYDSSIYCCWIWGFILEIETIPTLVLLRFWGRICMYVATIKSRKRTSSRPVQHQPTGSVCLPSDSLLFVHDDLMPCGTMIYPGFWMVLKKDVNHFTLCSMPEAYYLAYLVGDFKIYRGEELGEPHNCRRTSWSLPRWFHVLKFRFRTKNALI